ncbi:MAG TPA: HlyD family efflux transporter periplasmic adaptor subunit [Stellaceae bacterium]|nr:HlyD family efflux transporter periplasmic adaptor subunit [Stellaceae bacterium]
MRFSYPSALMSIGFMGVSRRLVAGIGVVAVLGYAAWIGGPYFRSVLVRDAAVTTWISIAPAPIGGYTTDVLYPGEMVGENGRIARMDNPLADRTPLAQAQGELDHAQVQLAAQRALVAKLDQIVATRAQAADAYATTFKHDLDMIIASATSNSALVAQRLDIDRAEENRKSTLMHGGNSSQAALDAATAQVTERQKSLTDIRTVLDRASSRRRAADLDVFMLDDGTDTGTEMRSLDDARLSRAQAEAALEGDEAAVEAARRVVDAARAAHAKARSRDVRAPPGSLVWSMMSAPGAAVRAGTPIGSWVDCRILLVDVPVSDVEVALLHKGSPADVVIEGEQATHGSVILLRGAAATLGSADLAALAKGRTPNIGQAIVRLDPTAEEIAACPIGHSAYVDFPGVSVIDLVRARLRI